MEERLQETALLVMDMQPGILANLPTADELIPLVAAAIDKARVRGLPVIYVRVGFRRGGPEISSSNKVFDGGRERFTKVDPEEWLKIHPGVAPKENDIIVTKRRFSAFTGSDLEVVLRAQGIRHLVLSGVSTSGVVLSTVREAGDKDFRLTVLSDCCGDADAEVQRVLMAKVFPRQADVVISEQWL